MTLQKSPFSLPNKTGHRKGCTTISYCYNKKIIMTIIVIVLLSLLLWWQYKQQQRKDYLWINQKHKLLSVYIHKILVDMDSLRCLWLNDLLQPFTVVVCSASHSLTRKASDSRTRVSGRQTLIHTLPALLSVRDAKYDTGQQQLVLDSKELSLSQRYYIRTVSCGSHNLAWPKTSITL